MIEYWRSRLSGDSEKMYDLLLKAIKSKKPVAQVPVTQNIANEISKMYQYVLSDHPELYHVSPQISAAISNRFLTVNFSNLYSEKEMKEIDRSFDNLRNDLRKELNKSDIEKAYAATFLLMKDSRYEINNIYNQNAASAIHYHAAQCSGFASAFKYAMDFLGVWCITVFGSVSNKTQSGPHAWNIVKLNGLYYHIDVTSFADEKLAEINQLLRCVLFESDDQKRQQGCVWNFSDTPKCSEMKMTTSSRTGDDVKNSQQKIRENTVNSDDSLPTFTRLFDIQTKITECIKKRISYYEFIVKISAYSNEKIMRMIMNDISAKGKELSAAFEVEVGCVNNKIYIKFNYKN